MIPSRVLLSVTALVLALGGAALLFAPDVAAGALRIDSGAGIWPWQVLAAAWLGLAALDWASRGSVVGGIYARPVASANFTHFLIVSLVLARVVLGGGQSAATWILFAVATMFALAFGQRLFFGAPEAELRQRR